MTESRAFEQNEIDSVKNAMLADPDGMAQRYLKIQKENVELGHDKLTGLLNRNNVESQSVNYFATAERHDEAVLALFIDLDKLKQTNDSLGHSEGNKLLKKMSDALTNTFRKSDIISRIGGDEFLVLTTIPNQGINSEQDIEVMLNRLFVNTNPDDFSLGISRVNSEEDLNEAIDIADKRMYVDKNRKDKKENGE